MGKRDDEVGYALRARLSAELDSFRPVAPMPAQARYRNLPVGRSWGGLRFGAGAVAGVVVVLLMGAGVAGAYRALTPVGTVAPKHVYGVMPSASPSPLEEVRLPVVAPPTPTPKPAESPEPAAAPRPEASPLSSPEPEGTDNPTPEPSGSSSPDT